MTKSETIEPVQELGQSLETKKALIQQDMQRDISDIKGLVIDIQTTLKENYVTKVEFNPVKEGLSKMQGFFYTIGVSCVLLIVAGVMKLLFKV